MLGGIITLLLAVLQDTRHGILLYGNPRACISVRINRNSLMVRKYFDLSCRSLYVIVCLQGVQEFTILCF